MECALENKRKGGLVIRPHFPYSGHTEDPVLIMKQLVDALEIRPNEFSYQEWYRYLNCGYRAAVVGGTDKMSALTAVGSTRTYAHTDPSEPFTYDNWAEAVRSVRTHTTNGPLLDMQVEGVGVGGEVCLPTGGGKGSCLYRAIVSSSHIGVRHRLSKIMLWGRMILRHPPWLQDEK